MRLGEGTCSTRRIAAQTKKVAASMAITKGVPSRISVKGASGLAVAARAGNAMIKVASAGEMMPDSDQVVCIMPLALGSRLSGTNIAYDASNAA
jgi:hypothetical protein